MSLHNAEDLAGELLLANKIKPLKPKLPLGIHTKPQTQAILTCLRCVWQRNLQGRLVPQPHAGLASVLFA